MSFLTEESDKDLYETCENQDINLSLSSIELLYILLVSMAVETHLIPSRTQKLSPPAAMVMQGRLCVRVARCQLYFF